VQATSAVARARLSHSKPRMHRAATIVLPLRGPGRSESGHSRRGGFVRISVIVAFLALLVGSPALAQAPAANPYTKGVRDQFDYIQQLVMRSAEKIGEDRYSFKPTPEVRSLAGVVGHIADSNNLLCRFAAGKIDVATAMKDLAALQVHEKKTSKAELIAGLKESSAYCQSVLDGLTDASGQETVLLFGQQPVPKLLVLTMVTSHAWEHYGNLVTYMRLKGIVPPSSER
jgi:uncharacterized damage-inducible protein DinB